MPPSDRENLDQLLQRLRSDPQFATVTVARSGANLKAWWPPLSEADLREAVAVARSVGQGASVRAAPARPAPPAPKPSEGGTAALHESPAPPSDHRATKDTCDKCRRRATGRRHFFTLCKGLPMSPAGPQPGYISYGHTRLQLLARCSALVCDACARKRHLWVFSALPAGLVVILLVTLHLNQEVDIVGSFINAQAWPLEIALGVLLGSGYLLGLPLAFVAIMVGVWFVIVTYVKGRPDFLENYAWALRRPEIERQLGRRSTRWERYRTWHSEPRPGDIVAYNTQEMSEAIRVGNYTGPLPPLVGAGERVPAGDVVAESPRTTAAKGSLINREGRPALRFGGGGLLLIGIYATAFFVHWHYAESNSRVFAYVIGGAVILGASVLLGLIVDRWITETPVASVTLRVDCRMHSSKAVSDSEGRTRWTDFFEGRRETFARPATGFGKDQYKCWRCGALLPLAVYSVPHVRLRRIRRCVLAVFGPLALLAFSRAPDDPPPEAAIFILIGGIWLIVGAGMGIYSLALATDMDDAYDVGSSDDHRVTGA